MVESHTAVTLMQTNDRQSTAEICKVQNCTVDQMKGANKIPSTIKSSLSSSLSFRVSQKVAESVSLQTHDNMETEEKKTELSSHDANSVSSLPVYLCRLGCCTALQKKNPAEVILNYCMLRSDQ